MLKGIRNLETLIVPLLYADDDQVRKNSAKTAFLFITAVIAFVFNKCR